MTAGAGGESAGPRPGRRRLLVVLLVLSAVLNLCFVAGAVWRRTHEPLRPVERIREVAGELNLTPQQRLAFDRYFRTMRARAQLMHAELDPIIADAWAEIAKPQPNQARISQLFDMAAQKRHDFARDATANTLSFLAALSPAQRAEFVTLLREHRQRWEHH